jgi:hypothetical protein
MRNEETDNTTGGGKVEPIAKVWVFTFIVTRRLDAYFEVLVLTRDSSRYGLPREGGHLHSPSRRRIRSEEDRYVRSLHCPSDTS